MDSNLNWSKLGDVGEEDNGGAEDMGAEPLVEQYDEHHFTLVNASPGRSKVPHVSVTSGRKLRNDEIVVAVLRLAAVKSGTERYAFARPQAVGETPWDSTRTKRWPVEESRSRDDYFESEIAFENYWVQG